MNDFKKIIYNTENLNDNIDYNVNLSRIDEVEELLNEICEGIPKYCFNKLNGGILLEEGIKYSPEAIDKDLICLGEYKRDIIGNTISIYYGSFMRSYENYSREELKEELKKVLFHEFTHHLEFLAHENDLEIEDLRFIEKYKKSKEEK